MEALPAIAAVALGPFVSFRGDSGVRNPYQCIQYFVSWVWLEEIDKERDSHQSSSLEWITD